jgi:hypothetical protein
VGTRAFGVAIRGIFTPRLAKGAKVSPKFVATEFKEGTKDAAKLGVNAAEASEAGATQEVSEDGFGLVVGGVRDGDSVDLAFGNEALKEGIASTPRGVFEIGPFAHGLGGDVLVADEAG